MLEAIVKHPSSVIITILLLSYDVTTSNASFTSNKYDNAEETMGAFLNAKSESLDNKTVQVIKKMTQTDTNRSIPDIGKIESSVYENASESSKAGEPDHKRVSRSTKSAPLVPKVRPISVIPQIITDYMAQDTTQRRNWSGCKNVPNKTSPSGGKIIGYPA